MKAYTTKPSDTQNLRVIEGERELTGNICAANQAYIGEGVIANELCAMDLIGGLENIS